MWRADAQLIPDLSSGDPSKVSSAVDEIKRHAIANYWDSAYVLGTLMRAKRYPDAESIALELIGRNPIHPGATASLEKLRAQALLEEDKPAEALTAAAIYYNTARLKDTSDAITLVAQCLMFGRPDEPGIARRFKRQQMAGASTQPVASPGENLGPPVLASIKIDPKPYEATIAKIKPRSYRDFLNKGNLLLLAGRFKEAHQAFENAYDLASDKAMPEAIENVARAIRAENGCVGPANAYILSLQQGDKP